MSKGIIGYKASALVRFDNLLGLGRLLLAGKTGWLERQLAYPCELDSNRLLGKKRLIGSMLGDNGNIIHILSPCIGGKAFFQSISIFIEISVSLYEAPT